MKTVLQAFELIGSAFTVYVSIRVIATIYDICQRWRTGNWDIE